MYTDNYIININNIINKEMTDKNAEYLVTAHKFFFDEYIVIEFKIKNTLP